MFILTLIKEYFTQYKIYFVQEIADSFIDLVESMPSPTLSNELINEVLKSGFVKKEKITKLQIMISEATNSEELKKLEYKEEALEVKPLVFLMTDYCVYLILW